MMQGAGALGMVAAVAVGVAALTAGGTSGTGTGRIQAANSAPTRSTPSRVTNAPSVTVVPAPERERRRSGHRRACGRRGTVAGRERLG